MGNLAFSKRKRLASNQQFKAVLNGNRRAGDGLLIVWVAPNRCGSPRLGVSIGKRCGNAVVRNRLKRLLRETFRQSQRRIPSDYDYVLMISGSTARQLRSRENGRDVLTSLTQGRVQRSFLGLIDTVFSSSRAKPPGPAPMSPRRPVDPRSFRP